MNTERISPQHISRMKQTLNSIAIVGVLGMISFFFLPFPANFLSLSFGIGFLLFGGGMRLAGFVYDKRNANSNIL